MSRGGVVPIAWVMPGARAKKDRRINLFIFTVCAGNVVTCSQPELLREIFIIFQIRGAFFPRERRDWAIGDRFYSRTRVRTERAG